MPGHDASNDLQQFGPAFLGFFRSKILALLGPKWLNRMFCFFFFNVLDIEITEMDFPWFPINFPKTIFGCQETRPSWTPSWIPCCWPPQNHLWLTVIFLPVTLSRPKKFNIEKRAVKTGSRCFKPPTFLQHSLGNNIWRQMRSFYIARIFPMWKSNASSKQKPSETEENKILRGPPVTFWNPIIRFYDMIWGASGKSRKALGEDFDLKTAMAQL